MPNIFVVVSVDWEGRSLLPENLQRMAAFRRKHPDVPMQHFLNAAYYTRPGIDAAQFSRAIHEVLLPEDDHGLHIHAWRSLLAAAGVEAADLQGVIKNSTVAFRAADDWGFFPAEPGYDVPIEDFAVDALGRMMRTSTRILVEAGFGSPVTFRAGGWMSGPKVQQALVINGFTLDCSAGLFAPVLRRFGEIPLCERMRQLWPAIDDTSQPFQVATPSGSLWELPNNAALVDYMTAGDVMEVFERNVARWQRAPHRHCFISTGFHQETARVFLDRLDEAVSAMKRMAAQRGWPLVFTGKPQDFLVCAP